ncbi:MAG: OmpA family protein [Gemmatimonadota bacterium]
MLKHRAVIILGVGLLALGAHEAQAQLLGGYVEPRKIRPGTVEIGGFGRWTHFADTVNAKDALGGGGRLGVFIATNLALEGEWSYAGADVDGFPRVPNDSLRTISHELWQARLAYNIPVGSRVWIPVGLGWAFDNYGKTRRVAPRTHGPAAQIGLRAGLTDWLHFRGDVYGNYALARNAADTEPYTVDGHFNFGAQAGLSLMFLRGRRVDTVTVEKTVQGPTVTIHDTVMVDRIVEKMTPGATILVGSVHFDFNKSDLSNDAKKILDQIAETLVQPGAENVRIEVVGNTDYIGSNPYNQRLSERRANQVADYLASKGVSRDRMAVSGKGKTDPVANNRNPEGRASNRRVLIVRTQ